MSKLSKEELLEFLNRFYALWREWMQEETTMPNMLKLAGEACEQIKELIQKPEVTEEWIEEKAVELYNYLYYETFCLDQVRGFIRLLVKEYWGK